MCSTTFRYVCFDTNFREFLNAIYRLISSEIPLISAILLLAVIHGTYISHIDYPAIYPFTTNTFYCKILTDQANVKTVLESVWHFPENK
jgi:hypothetical protein